MDRVINVLMKTSEIVLHPVYFEKKGSFYRNNVSFGEATAHWELPALQNHTTGKNEWDACLGTAPVFPPPAE